MPWLDHSVQWAQCIFIRCLFSGVTTDGFYTKYGGRLLPIPVGNAESVGNAGFGDTDGHVDRRKLVAQPLS